MSPSGDGCFTEAMTTGGTTHGRVALESQALERMQAAVLLTDLSGVVLYANSYCEILYGRSPDELVGEYAGQFASDPTADPAADPSKQSMLSEITAAVLDGRSWEGEFRIERSDGSVVDLHVLDSPIFDDTGDVTGMISLAYDAAAPRLSASDLRRILAVAQILRDIGATLVSELDADTVMKTVTGAARKLAGASLSAFLRLDSEDSDAQFFVRATSGRARHSSLGVAVPLNAPLLAEALASATPYRFDDASDDESYVATLDDVMPALEPPLRSCVVVAVRSRDGDVVGAMLLAHTEAKRFTSADEQLLADIAAQAGIVLDIARLFRAAEVEIAARRRAEEVQRFYAETSAVLSLSLDYPESFEQLGRLCVPFLADLCLIDVAGENDVRRLAAVHVDPGKRALVAELETEYPPDQYGAHPAASVLRGGPAVVAAEMSDEYLRATTRDERHLQVVKELDFTSYMCVPIQARGRVLGSLTLVSSGSGRHFGPSDLAHAEEFARRAGLAIDNARLYSERDHVARALQSSLLPPSLPEIMGAHVTARYQAAGEGNEVGGDFYHVFQVDERAWWFVIGDVSGKGPEAAAIAGLARHTLRAFALQERSPSRLLAALHETLLVDEENAEFCTVCCALLQPSEHGAQLSIACGGHPPPIIRRANGTVEVATCRGPLLGMPLPIGFEEQAVQLAPGDVVVLYTDGVTEVHHRDQPLFGEERLVEVIRRADGDVDRVADDILAAVRNYGPAEPRDDLAVVVLQIDS
jgi:PAS domain S-box-containing protein